MTHADVFMQILHEVTGRPKAEVRVIVEQMQQRFPGQTRFDEELSPDKAEHLLAALRQEKSGILNWLIKGQHLASDPPRRP